MRRFTFTLLVVIVFAVLMTGVVRLARHQSHKNQAIARAARECGQGFEKVRVYTFLDPVITTDCIKFNLFDGRNKVEHKVWLSHRFSDQWRKLLHGDKIFLEYHPEGVDPSHPYEPEAYEAPQKE